MGATVLPRSEHASPPSEGEELFLEILPFIVLFKPYFIGKRLKNFKVFARVLCAAP